MSKKMMKSKLDELKNSIVTSRRPIADLQLLSLFVEIGYNDKGKSMNHSIQFTNEDFTHLRIFNHRMADVFPNLVKYLDVEDDMANRLHLDVFIDVPLDAYLSEIEHLSIKNVEIMR